MTSTQWCSLSGNPDSNVHVAYMGPTWVLSAPGGPHEPCYQGITAVGSKDVGLYHHDRDTKCIFIAPLPETTWIILCHTYLFYVQN